MIKAVNTGPQMKTYPLLLIPVFLSAISNPCFP
jgi:hypothetical protein